MPGSGTGPELLDIARTFRSRILAERDRIEAARRLPEDLACELARAGFFRIFLPATYGGLDLTPMDGIAVFEELAKADASVAWCVWNGNTHWTAAQLSPEAGHAIHDDPCVITANNTQPSGQAHVVEGGFRVTGRWSLVSGCELASWMVLWSVVHADGKPRVPPTGGPEIRFMLLPASQCEIIDTWTVGGVICAGSPCARFSTNGSMSDTPTIAARTASRNSRSAPVSCRNSTAVGRSLGTERDPPAGISLRKEGAANRGQVPGLSVISLAAPKGRRAQRRNGLLVAQRVNRALPWMCGACVWGAPNMPWAERCSQSAFVGDHHPVAGSAGG
jgi:hypothetical protein